MTEAFLTRLFSGAPPGLLLELRAFRDGRPTTAFFPVGPGGYARAARWAQDLRATHDVYAGVLPRVRNDGHAAAVPLAQWLFADVDQGDGADYHPMALLRMSGLPEPTMVVRSGSRWSRHLYWRLKDPVPLASDADRERYKGVLRRIVMALGGEAPGAHADRACADVARILRLPGSQNHKWRPPTRCVLEPDLDGPLPEPQSYLWWRCHLPAEPVPASRPIPSTSGHTPDLAAWASRGYPEHSRHRSLLGAAGWLLHDVGLTADDARVWLLHKAQASAGSHPATAGEVEGILRWAAR